MYEYDVRVGVEAFAVLNVSQLNVKNRVIAQSSNSKQLQNGDLQAFNANFGVQYNHWVKKLVGDPINEEKNVSISGNIYQQTSLGKVDKMESAPSDFTVPKGSYLYTVTVNNLGDWDVSSASMKDTLGSEHMEFVGFVEVQAHDVKTNRLVETRWVKVDQQRAFDFTPQDIGFIANQYKYVFKYYAKPVQMDNVSQVMVSNNFTLSGEIGLGNAKYELTGISARKDVVISGSRSFEAMKHSWYYEGAKSTVGQWRNGAIYWVIQVQGTSIEKGTQLKDFIPKVTPNSNLDHSYLHSDSVLGVFKGTFPDNKSFLDYSDLETVKQSGNLTELGNEYYKVNYSNSQNFSGEGNFSEVVIEMKQSLTLSPDSLYVVVKSEPQNIPLENRSWKEYKNGLATSDKGTDWAERNVTSKNLYGGENILKELGRVVSWDGKSLEDINSVKGGDIFKEYLPGPGIYTSWAIKVNYAGNLSGAYRVIDTVPEGMEVAYARLKWRGDRYNNVNEKPLLSQIPDMVKNGWEEHTITGGTDKNKTPVTSYYYTKGNQVCWEVNNLIAGKERDTSSVDCQIVCRLTDSDVLQGGVEKTFENTVSLVNPVGVEVDNDTNPVTIKTSNMSKSAVSKNDSSSIPFTIRVNELGQDLLKDATTITLLDEMSSTLKLDTTSIQVKNIKTDTFLDKSEYKASLDTMPTGSKTQILRIVLPDNLPLEITYKATVQAKPGEKVSLSNKAYWEGYTNTGGSNVEIEDFEYSVGGTVEVDHTPQVKITKNDKNDLSHFLSGAEFQMVEGKVEEGKFQVSSDEVWIGTTGKNGELTFGDDPLKLMSFNMVYRIMETKAPDGYVLDTTPHFFIVAEKDKESGKYPEYPITADGQTIDVFYPNESVIYELDIANRKGEICVEKNFANAGGDPTARIKGTYTFGIYEKSDGTNIDGSDKPLQIVKIVIAEGQQTAAKATFTDLELNKTYYIFELDDVGKPIRFDAISNVNGLPFKVTYNGQGTSGNSATNGQTVSVTNQSCVSLPETGGTGINPYITSGMLLLIGGLGLLMLRNKKRGKEKKFS